MIKRGIALAEARKRRREEMRRDSDDEYDEIDPFGDTYMSTDEEVAEEEEEEQRQMQQMKKRKAKKQRKAAAGTEDDQKEGEEEEEEEEEEELSLRGTRVLMIGSRGITNKHKELMKDLARLLPQVRCESKMDPRDPPAVINEISDMRSCNHAMFFDSRRHSFLYLDIARVPDGPTLRFFVREMHTAEELNLTGNCLRGSRALLSFSAEFDSEPRWQMAKTLLGEVFAVPDHHPRSKPFIDHVFMFSLQNGLIYFRNYQIVDHGERRMEDRHLVEIGPRLTLEPVRYFASGFCGQIIYENYDFLSPNAARFLRESRLIQNRDRSAELRKKNKELHDKARREPTELEMLFK